MAMGQQKDRQGDLMVGWAEMPRSPGHVFYDCLQSVLIEGGFDGFAEATCKPYYAARLGAPSVPPGRYFRMHLVGYFEGINSERGLEWRCSDSLSLREFLRLESGDRVPDHSWLSKTRTRLPHEVHAEIFDWVLALIAKAGLVKGDRIGVDASTMEANAALRNIVRRDTGEGYREMLEHLARDNVHKRYLFHVAGHNLSLLMRHLIGAGTPKEAVAGGYGCIFVLIAPTGSVLVVQIVLIVSQDGETAFAALCFAVG